MLLRGARFLLVFGVRPLKNKNSRCLDSLFSQAGWVWSVFLGHPFGNPPKPYFAALKKFNRSLCHTKFGNGQRRTAPCNYTVPTSPHDYAIMGGYCCRASISQSLTRLFMYGHTIVVTYIIYFDMRQYFIRDFFFFFSQQLFLHNKAVARLLLRLIRYAGASAGFPAFASVFCRHKCSATLRRLPPIRL